jgi:putative membrane protein
MMAWVRTATSMITFGFTIYKFFQFEFQRGAPQVRSLVGPRLFALILIGTGLVALLLAVLQHRQAIRHLPATQKETPFSLSALVAGLIAILGLLAWVTVLLRQ